MWVRVLFLCVVGHDLFVYSVFIYNLVTTLRVIREPAVLGVNYELVKNADYQVSLQLFRIRIAQVILMQINA